ncbi:MAG: tyrosine-type recombinase/integrase [SAR324 cluster bacterium]
MEPRTLAVIVSQYAAHLQAEKAIAKGTRERYVALARGLLSLCAEHPDDLFLPADWGLAQLDRRIVETYLNTLKAERGWKPISMAYYITALSAFFRFLRSRNHIAVNPCARLRPRLDGTFSDPPGDEAQAVLRLFEAPGDTLERARVALLVELLYGAGLRPSQAYGVRSLQVDTAEGRVRILSGEAWQELALSAAGTARAERYLALREQAIAALQEPGQSAEDVAFWIDRRGRACPPARLARHVSRAMRAAGLAGGPASLRVLSARHFGQGGADIRSVQRLLGARRLGHLDRFQPPADLKQLIDRFRRAHPRQSSE